MTKPSDFQRILSEIELFLNAGRYEDAKVLLNFVDYDAADRTTRLQLLLINATIDGPFRYQGEIDHLANLSNPNDSEKDLVRKILLLASKSDGLDERNYRPNSGPRNQALEEVPAREIPASPSADDSGQRRIYETEPDASREPRAEITASNDHAVHSLQEALDQQAALLQTKEAALASLKTSYGETIRLQETQLRDRGELLEKYDAQLETARSELDRVTTQLAELADAKDRQVELLREELSRRTEILQVKDRAIRHLEEQYAEQIHAMELQLGEKQQLLKNRDAELDSLNVKLSELTREHAELKSVLDNSESLAREDLRGKATLLHSMATAIDDLEEQSSSMTSSLQRQLTAKQKIVDLRDVEIAALRGQILAFTERLADAEAARYGSAARVQGESLQASQAVPANRSDRDRPIDTRVRLAKSIDIASMALVDTISDCLGGLWRAWQKAWTPRIFSPTALPVAASVLLIIPVAYLLAVQGRTTAIPNPNVDLKPAQESEASEVSESAPLPLKELKPPPAAGTGSRKIVKRDAPPQTVATYVTRRPVTLRESPRYAATAKTQIVSGTEVSVIATQGDWFKIKTQPTGTVGYVRKEYLLPHNSAKY